MAPYHVIKVWPLTLVAPCWLSAQAVQECIENQLTNSYVKCLSPFYGLKLQIEPNSTRCHYPLMTYLTKIEALTALSIQWSLASMQPQRRPHINLHIKTQWGISAENYVILILQAFCLDKKWRVS